MNAEIYAFDPQPGVSVALGPGLTRILAPNPSPMTFRGTNTYLVGTKDLAVIDPGPNCVDHAKAILNALRPGQSISHIMVTHAHTDHSPLAKHLSHDTGAPIYAFGGPKSGRSLIMQELAAKGFAGGGEGVDAAFAPDRLLAEGDSVIGSDWVLEAIHTPGHFGNHLSFAWGNSCFVGDHVMGWASSLVSPPDGDLTDFMASCEKLSNRKWQTFHPGHGSPVTEPNARLEWLINHRTSREKEILHALHLEPAAAHDLARQIYTDTPAALISAATRNVFAHLVDLFSKNKVKTNGELHARAIFELL